MKLDVSKLPYQKQFELVENVEFNKDEFVCHVPLLEVLSCKTKINVQRFEEFIYVNMYIDAEVLLQCSYTLKHFKTHIKGSDELHFSSEENLDDEDLILYKGNIINLDEHIFNLLSASIPLSPKAPGAIAPTDGKDYRIISDSELKKEKEELGNSQFDILKDLDFD